MSRTSGPIVPSYIGNDQFLSPIVSLPVLRLLPVFASMVVALEAGTAGSPKFRHRPLCGAIASPFAPQDAYTSSRSWAPRVKGAERLAGIHELATMAGRGRRRSRRFALRCAPDGFRSPLRPPG